MKNYIGLDAHCKHCVFVVKDNHGQLVKRARVKTTEKELLTFVRGIKRFKVITFEESHLSHWLYLLLKDEVDQLIVCDPAAKGRRQGPKTDFIDATEMADLLRAGMLKPVFHTADKRMELRTLVSGYDDLVQEHIRSKNRLKALFRLTAISTNGGGFYQNKNLINQLPNSMQQFVAKPLYEQIELFEEQKQNYLERFKKNLSQYKEMKLLCSIPGFDRVRANQLVGIIVTPYRFPDKYKFLSYAQLVKHRQISDGKVYGNKNPVGRTQLKAIFKMAASTVLRGSNGFRRIYEQKLSEGLSEKAARNAVTRSLAATVLAVWKSGKKYNDRYQEAKQREERATKKKT